MLGVSCLGAALEQFTPVSTLMDLYVLFQSFIKFLLSYVALDARTGSLSGTFHTRGVMPLGH